MVMKWIDNKKESELVDKIMARAKAMKIVDFSNYLSFRMDIEACHANGNPLNLAELLNADNFNFTHDLVGIYSNINRSTGKLQNYFVPRFSKKQGKN